MSPPIVFASKGRIRLWVNDTISPQMPSPRITAISSRPIHVPASAAGDSDAVFLAISSISGVMQIVPQLHCLGKAVE